MDMMEESETSISTVFSVCLQWVWFTWTRSVGSTEVQCLRNNETVTFSVSGIVHKLGNSTTLSGFISFHNGNTSGPELQQQTQILSQTCNESGILFKCLKAQPAAGVPEMMLGGTRDCRPISQHVLRGTKNRSSCEKMQTVQLITLKDWKRKNKCWCCGNLHPPESYHIVLLYCMPVLEEMLDQGSKERSRDWA